MGTVKFENGTYTAKSKEESDIMSAFANFGKLYEYEKPEDKSSSSGLASRIEYLNRIQNISCSKIEVLITEPIYNIFVQRKRAAQYLLGDNTEEMKKNLDEIIKMCDDKIKQYYFIS